MRFFKYIIKSIHLLNIALIIAVIFLVRYAVLPVLNTSIKFTPPKSMNTLLAEDEKPVTEQIPSIAEFMMVAEQNLFHPERIIPAEKSTLPPETPPEIVLYGTLITGNESYAYVEDKKSSYTTPGRGKRQLVLRKGSVIGGYTLTDIEDNKIELVKGENRIIVDLTNSGKPKAREMSASGASEVLPGISPAANRVGSAFPQTTENKPGRPSKQTTSPPGGKYPMAIPPSASGTAPISNVTNTENAATRNIATPYLSPRTRARMMQMQNNQNSLPASP